MPTTTNDHPMIHRLSWEDKEIILIGTAHVSRESVELVSEVLENERPDTVSVELCESRYDSIRKKKQWQDTNIIKVIREKKAFLLLSNILLASFQRRIAEKLDVKPGEEMMRAIETGEAIGAEIHLADRDIRVTLSRTWRMMGLWSKLKLLFQLMLSVGDIDEISEEDIEEMKQADVLETLLADVGKTMPLLREILIDERDRFLTEKIRTAPGKKIVAVVGAGHVPGIKASWQDTIDIAPLEEIPPRRKISGLLKWLIPAGIVLLIVLGFFYGGLETGTDMLTWWILANGVFAGIGAALALAHPVTVITAILAAPLTSLNPMIAAGWVSGLVEAYTRKPKVIDFESLPDDMLSIRGFWRNKVTRVLLVVVFTNIGSSLGTFVAIPLMAKIL
ncbi:MAG: TraB/GumN family protein [Desulfobacterales bacterium]